MDANISTKTRKLIYCRDGYRCALCDSTQYLQVHHLIPRGHGGSDHPYNLICLCSTCHAQAHGINAYDEPDFDPSFIEQAMIEYLADYYADSGDWNPWRKDSEPWRRE